MEKTKAGKLLQSSDLDIPLEDFETPKIEFLLVIARSISELSPSVDDVVDVMVFLEVLGYQDKDAKANGFADLYDLSKQVFTFIDYYGVQSSDRSDGQQQEQSIGVTSFPRTEKSHKRVTEALVRAFPSVASLIILYAFGFSLWMTFVLPLPLVTAMIAGVYTGLAISEGSVQSFGRLFAFHNEQGNISEVNIVLKRMYKMQSLILLGVLVATIGISIWAKIQPELVGVFAITLVTITYNRISYVIVYGLKKFGPLAVSYIVAFVALVLVYFFSSNLFPSTETRYFVALCVAFGILSIVPIVYQCKLWLKKNKPKLKHAQDANIPHFFKPPSISKKTLRSKLHIQLWETALYGIYATLFFFMLFSDRIISWFANAHSTIDGFIPVPLFNSVYHTGADTALIVFFPVLIVQYLMTESIYVRLTNATARYSISEFNEINDILKEGYLKLVGVAVTSSAVTAGVLVVVGTLLLSRSGASAVSLKILDIAAIANILMGLFSVNAQFMMAFLNKPRSLVIISAACVAFVILAGSTMTHLGLEYITLAYLGSASGAALATSIVMYRNLKKAATIFLAK